MESTATRLLLERISPRALTAVVFLLGLSFVATVLVPGLQLATDMSNTTAALKFIGEQQRAPDVIRTSLEAVRDRLGARDYMQAPLDELRKAVAQWEAAQRAMEHAQPAGWFETANETAAFADRAATLRIANLRQLWRPEREALEPVILFDGVPYQDSEATGTILNDNGHQLGRDVATAVRATHRLLPPFDAELAMMSADLQARNAYSATRLRVVMLAGLLIASALVVLVALLLGARRRQAESVRLAREQTENILRTVKEGLFLLDRNLIIGPTYSSALETLFQRKQFAGLEFQELLRDIVAERTLNIAVKFVGVLWSERTKENLVKSINPLGEVEVKIRNPQGVAETRYLEFDFHRVRANGKIAQVLVSVFDATARVELAHELSVAQSQAQAQLDTMLGIMHVDSAQLATFLGDSDAAMKMINAVLREPARDEPAFRRKLDTLFRQAHSVKGEAASLGLSSIESRAHAFEDDLKVLRDKPELSGNDFLPLVIKLDDLLTHLQSIGDMVARLSRLHAGPPDPVHEKTLIMARPASESAPAPSPIVPILRQLAARVAAENHKEAELQCIGFDAIPDDYRRLVKDVAVQAVRNAIVHGIELPQVREAAGKPACGVVRLEFQDGGEPGYRLTIEDDGLGISTERIKEVAVQKGLIPADRAASLDVKQVFSLLFQPGFSTADGVTKDAGRGVGMNLMAELVREVGGRVGVATKPGRFTRLTLTMPHPSRQPESFEAA